MTTSIYDRFATLLRAKEEELASALGRRDGIAIEPAPDTLDQVQFAVARELKTRNLERETGQLREARAALGRIADGTYGHCLECDEPISHKRLSAIPWATLCIQCQEQADLRRKQGQLRDTRSYFMDAA
jgi:DnaK suppressor protein